MMRTPLLAARAKRRLDADAFRHDDWLSGAELLTMRADRRGGAGG